MRSVGTREFMISAVLDDLTLSLYGEVAINGLREQCIWHTHDLCYDDCFPLPAHGDMRKEPDASPPGPGGVPPWLTFAVWWL